MSGNKPKVRFNPYPKRYKRGHDKVEKNFAYPYHEGKWESCPDKGDLDPYIKLYLGQKSLDGDLTNLP
jgi:hypothetical protein